MDDKTPTFDELVDMATRDIHSSLLEGGSKEMRGAIHTWMTNAIMFEKQFVEKQKKSARKK